MKLVELFIFALAALPAVLAAPVPQPADTASQQNSSFYLRVDAPKEPWNGHRLVELPTTQYLGIENFTVHPPAPPIHVQPIKLASGKYALRGDELPGYERVWSYLTLLISPDHVVAMKILPIGEPTDDAIKTSGRCPAGYICKADEFRVTESNGTMSISNALFQWGAWEPRKDARSKGWIVYWSTPEHLFHPVKLDLVPCERSF